MKNKVYFNNTYYKNEIELLNKVIKIYSITRMKYALSKKEESILVFYIKYGYTSETKDLIKETLNIKNAHMNQLNYSLQKKGYLVQDNNNRQKKNLAKGLIGIRDNFLKDKLDIYVIKFNYNG